MLPYSPAPDSTDRRNRNAEFFGEADAFFFGRKHLSRLLASKNSPRVQLTALHSFGVLRVWVISAAQYGRGAISPLCAAVRVIVFLGAYKEVVGACARRVIAFVQHPHSFRNRANKRLVRKSVCSNPHASFRNYQAVPAAVSSARSCTTAPAPTAINRSHHVGFKVAAYRAVLRPRGWAFKNSRAGFAGA